MMPVIDLSQERRVGGMITPLKLSEQAYFYESVNLCMIMTTQKFPPMKGSLSLPLHQHHTTDIIAHHC